MKTLIYATIYVLVSVVSPSIAFAPTPFSLVKQTQSSKLNASVGENYNDDPLAGRTCPHQLLTQRSLQSFMFLLQQMRDPHTIEWLELLSDTNPGQLLEYHGTGALDFRLFPEWDTFLQELMDQPEDILIIEVKTRAQNSGLSKNNPYREKEGKPMLIEIDIDPVSLAGRLLSVREKLGKEWVQDLELLSSINGNILKSYHERILAAREDEERSKADNDEKDDSHYDNSLGDAGTDGNPFSNFGWQTNKNQAFERDSIYTIVNHPNFNDCDASPLRSTNFDLLSLLSIQESIHRILQKYESEDKDLTFEWLLDYYDDSLPKYFDGDQRFGRADDFLDDLLRKGPILKTTDDGKIDFIDPLAIAEDIIETRGIVVEEWKSTMSNVSDYHTDIRRVIFEKQMSKWGQRVEMPREEKKEKKSETIISSEMGDFQ